MKPSLSYSLLHGENKCTGSTRPGDLSVAFLILSFGGSLIGIANAIVEDPVCVPVDKKIRHKLWSLLIWTVTMSLQLFVLKNYVERCNGLAGYILTTVLSVLLLYVPLVYQRSHLDAKCVSDRQVKYSMT